MGSAPVGLTIKQVCKLTGRLKNVVMEYQRKNSCPYFCDINLKEAV